MILFAAIVLFVLGAFFFSAVLRGKYSSVPILRMLGAEAPWVGWTRLLVSALCIYGGVALLRLN